MTNNTGYDVNYRETLTFTDKIAVTMYIEQSLLVADKITGKFTMSKTNNPTAFISVVKWLKDLDNPFNSRMVDIKEFEEEADYYRFLAKIQKEIKEEENHKRVMSCVHI